MKRLFKYILILSIFFLPQICRASNNEFLTEEMLNNPQAGEINLDVNTSEQTISEVEDDVDNIENEFGFFDNLGKDEDAKAEESSLLQKVIKTKITRTDIQSFLLEDQLTMKYNKGPIDEVQYFMGYRGAIGGFLTPHNYSTKYDNLTTEFGVFGKFKNPNYDFKLKFRPIPKEGLNYIDNFIGDAYIVNEQIPHHKMITGYSRVQTGVEGGMSSFVLPFVTRSQIARAFGNSRSLSVKVIGNYNYADYSISGGSSGRYITSGFPGAEFNGWLNIKPFGSHDGKYGKLTLGGGINAGHNRNDYKVGSMYIGYKHKRLWTNFEAAVADGYSGSEGISDKRASGLAFTLGWKFKPYLQLIGRVDSFDPDRHVHNNRRNEYTVGLNWFIKGQALKFVFNYVYCQYQNAPDGHRFIMATQVML